MGVGSPPRPDPAAASCPAAPSPDGPVVRRSGTSLCLGPGSTPTAVSSFEWKVQLRSDPRPCVLFASKAGARRPGGSCGPAHRLRFSGPAPSLLLLLEAARPDDSGTYCLEVTGAGGAVRTHRFHVSVLDPVGPPELRLLEQAEAAGGARCRVTLNCSAPGGEVTYAWARGGERIPAPRSPFRLEEQIDAGGRHTFTCNASNPVSWASRSLQLGPGCGSAGRKLGLLPLSLIIVVPILTLLGTLTCVCAWRRGRKPAEPRPEASLTVYEDVHSPPLRSGQERRQEQDFPGNGSTVYSMVLPQSSASTSQETAATLYSVVLPAEKSGAKKRGHSPSVYEEVGKIQPRAQHPA
ncbi:junctional adhesion molecule A isoform X6 [Eptesicus fuscus]|uniref:junctional adhesion molecule A isoform X6 n=1 Tax=Eptesicus fuscus TaxID=29078 RepID=UPI00240457F4|nr:junctional adhesion molecule A isoform X6 [Eptesicus fuscus]